MFSFFFFASACLAIIGQPIQPTVWLAVHIPVSVSLCWPFQGHIAIFIESRHKAKHCRSYRTKNPSIIYVTRNKAQDYKDKDIALYFAFNRVENLPRQWKQEEYLIWKILRRQRRDFQTCLACFLYNILYLFIFYFIFYVFEYLIILYIIIKSLNIDK